MIRIAIAFIVFSLVSVVASASEGPEKYVCGSDKEDEWFSEDKLLHVVASAFLVGASYRVYHSELNNPEKNSRVFAVSLTAVAGAGKELYDMSRPNQTASWKDIAADVTGIALGVLLFTYIN